MGVRDRDAYQPEKDDGAVLLRNFLGINNVDEEDRLDFRYLRDAVNLDLSRQGRLRRRQGRTVVYTGDVRRLWTNGSRVLMAVPAAILELQRVGASHSTSTVRSDTSADGFVDVEGGIYFSYNGRLGHLVSGFPVDFAELKTHEQIFGAIQNAFYPTQALTEAVRTSIEEIQRRFLRPMVGGKKLVHYRGRVYTAIGNTLYWSEPLRYLYTQLDINYMMFDSDITLLAATPEQLVVATATTTVRLAGERPAEFKRVRLFNYGTPDTEAVQVPATQLGLEGTGEALVWMSHQGLCMAMPGGAMNMTEKTVAFPRYDGAAVAFREQRGHRQVLSSARRTDDIGFGIGDQAVAEIRRNGVAVN